MDEITYTLMDQANVLFKSAKDINDWFGILQRELELDIKYIQQNANKPINQLPFIHGALVTCDKELQQFFTQKKQDIPSHLAADFLNRKQNVKPFFPF